MTLTIHRSKQGGRVMAHDVINACGAIGASCTLLAYIVDKLPIIAAALSIIWLTLQIGWFLWCRYKDWKK